jgi:hypothetical protein
VIVKWQVADRKIPEESLLARQLCRKGDLRKEYETLANTEEEVDQEAKATRV